VPNELILGGGGEMTARMSSVKDIQLISVSDASLIHIGDSVGVTPRARGLAVQREVAVFKKDEGDFSDPLFSEPLPKPLLTENVHMTRFNESPFINVNRLHIMSAGNAVVIQIGSNQFIDTQARIKHFRQFFSQPSKENKKEEQ
jgi:spore germination protein PE